MALPRTGVYRNTSLSINEVDVSPSVELVEFLNLTHTMPDWKMVVRFRSEPQELDTFDMVGNIYPINFSPSGGDVQSSINQYALVSNWDGSSITLKPSKRRE